MYAVIAALFLLAAGLDEPMLRSLAFCVIAFCVLVSLAPVVIYRLTVLAYEAIYE